MSDSIIVEEVIADLERVQDFQPRDLVQSERLGAEAAFTEAVEPAERLIDLFNQLPSSSVWDLPTRQKQNVQTWSKAAYNLFEQILSFSVNEGNIQDRKTQLVQQLSEAFQTNFNHLSPLISYSMARKVDFNRLSEEGRAAVQGVRDETAKLLEEIERTSENASTVLDEVKEAAAQQGVTQMAKYFADEAVEHQKASKNWLAGAIVSTIVLIIYVTSTFYFVVPDTIAAAIQSVSSKIIMFFTLAFVVFQCAKNYATHRHNFVVNRHRQNSLMTFTTLTEASTAPDARDVVLQHASAAIYAPIDSGYTKKEERGYNSNALSGAFPRTSISSSVSD